MRIYSFREESAYADNYLLFIITFWFVIPFFFFWGRNWGRIVQREIIIDQKMTLEMKIDFHKNGRNLHKQTLLVFHR